MFHYCTIITENYFAYTLALRDSLKKLQQDVHLHVFISDIDEEKSIVANQKHDNISLYFSGELCYNEVGVKIHEQYRNKRPDAFRWSMKPVFLSYLIQKKQLDKILYLDCDLYFYQDPSFLFDELERSNVILTPHWRSVNPTVEPKNFHILLTSGQYNAGFIGINKYAIDTMNWWANLCAYQCIVDFEKGLYDDQRYLDLFAVYFNKVLTLKHKGCNIANWNQLECKRIQQADGSVLINNEFPIIFIHYTGSTIRGILKGQEEVLLPYLLEYENVLEKYGIDKIGKERNLIQQSRSNADKSLISRIYSKLMARF